MLTALSFTARSCLILGAVLGTTPALADLRTIDPTSFPPRENVSHATQGVTLSTMSLVPATSIPGSAEFKPELSPVFATPMTGVLGTGDFFTGTPNDLWDAKNFNDGYNANVTDCLKRCLLEPSGSPPPSLLDIHFTKPVSYVNVLEYANFANLGFVQAFDRQGKLIAYCQGTDGFPSQGRPGCFSIVGGNGFDDVWRFAISDSTANISTLLVSSSDGNWIGKIQFSKSPLGVPEPATLSLLVFGLAGVGLMRRRVGTLGGT